MVHENCFILRLLVAWDDEKTGAKKTLMLLWGALLVVIGRSKMKREVWSNAHSSQREVAWLGPSLIRLEF